MGILSRDRGEKTAESGRYNVAAGITCWHRYGQPGAIPAASAFQHDYRAELPYETFQFRASQWGVIHHPFIFFFFFVHTGPFGFSIFS